MSEALSRDRITEIYRPVLETDWMSEVTEYAAEAFGDNVRIDDPANLTLPIISRRELGQIHLPLSQSAEYVAGKLRSSMPDSFTADLAIVVTGAAYLQKKVWNKRVPLLVKLETAPELINENNAAYDTLARYGVLPPNDFPARFSFFIGGVTLGNLDGETKVRLRFGVGDRIPKTLKVGPGIVATAATF